MLLPLAAGESVPFLREAALLALAAAVFGYVCQRVKIVPIVGFLLAGVLVGPGGLGVVGDRETVAALAEYGVILLLFTIGLEFSLGRLWAIKNLIFGAGGLQTLGTAAVVTAIVWPLGGWRAGVFTGCLVALSSTAIVLKLLGDAGKTQSDVGRASVGVLIFQDLAVVAMVMLVPMLAPDGEGGVGPLLRAVGVAVAVITAVLLFARKIVPIILEYVARTCRGEIFLLSVIAICVATAWLTSLAGVSAALGAFLGGLVVSESKFRHHALGEVMPLQILFSAAFFVSVGMLLDPRFVVANPLIVVAVIVAAAVVKFVIATLAVKAVGRPWRTSAGAGLALAQVGEFAFVLATVGVAAGLSPLGREDGYDVFIAASVVLMLLTPVMVAGGFKIAGDATPTLADDGGHVVIDGWGEAGRAVAASLREAGRRVVVVTLNPAGAREAEGAGFEVVRGATDRAASLAEAGAERADLIVIGDDDAEATERAAAVARQFADRDGRATRIVARVSPGHAEAVRAAGADVVIESANGDVGPLVRAVSG